MLRILTYHRIAELTDSPSLDPRSISATPASFALQMQHLARYYHVVSMTDVLQAVEQQTPLPKRSVLITFDDAYIDFADNAWPILRQWRLPATLFVPTAQASDPGRAFWWDRLYQAFVGTSRTECVETPLGPLSLAASEERQRGLRALQNHVKTLPHAEAMRLVDDVCARLGGITTYSRSVLGWDQLRRLKGEGLTLGSHTRTHTILTQLPPEQIRSEISGSQQDLKREIGSVLPIFCYPNGGHDDVTTAILRDEGIVLAFTTLAGNNELGTTDLLRLRRTDIRPRTSLVVFRLRLLGPAAYVDAWRQRTRKAELSQQVSPRQATVA
ncbi:MAG TPA: polysaccharide deacetylase family protein [Terriglobia bacterium]|nr:polysaccharide deacetylase family protein [Terriglobia bacterium]